MGPGQGDAGPVDFSLVRACGEVGWGDGVGMGGRVWMYVLMYRLTDRSAMKKSKPQPPPHHRTTQQTCESGEALLDALKGKREFMLAVAQRKVRAQGNLAKLTVLKEVFAGAASTAVDGNGGSGNGGPPMLVPLPKSEWEPDGPACSQCQARFSLTNRRHHCRWVDLGVVLCVREEGGLG